MQYLITGHRGLIGSHLKKRLDKDNECIGAIDIRDGSDINNLNYMEGKKADIMFHFAAQCKINQAIKYPILPFEGNVRGTFNVLEYCRRNKIPKIMISSSSRILSPEKNPYTASKVYGEELIKAYHECYGLEYIIIRPSTVYGPCYDETGRLLHNFVVNAIKGKDLEIYGDMFKSLDFTYIDDFIDGIMLAMNKWNEDYDISGGDERKILEVARMVVKEAKSMSRIRFYPKEIAQPQQIKIDNSKIRNLGFEPRISIEEGIKKMVKWYQENPPAWKYYKSERLFNGKFI